MKIETLGDLCNLIEELKKNYSLDEKICLSDRFNEYQISDSVSYSEDHIIIPCESIGSALTGTHRVLGRKK